VRINNLNLFFLSITIFGAILGGLIGKTLGNGVLLNVLPPWQTINVATNGHTFVEIAAVEIDESETANRYYTIYLKTEAGEYFAFSQNNLEPTIHPESEINSAVSVKQSCTDFPLPPPVLLIREAKDSAGFFHDGALDGTQECYLLSTDNHFQIWERYVDFFDFYIIPRISILIGLIIGSLIAGYSARKIERQRAKSPFH
jgi:hypothetical protein